MMRGHRSLFSIVAIVGFGVIAPATVAQQPDGSVALRSPRFLLEAADVRVPVDLSRSPALGRAVHLDLRGTSLRDAIAELSRQSGLAIAFSDDVVPPDARVTLTPRATNVAAALSELLAGKGLDVVMRPDGSAAIVRQPIALAGTITGKVTDAAGSPLAAVSVSIEGGSLGATTQDDGTYRIAQVPPGTHTLVARRIGYLLERRTVRITASEDVTADFQLVAAATSLQGVVTTATGQQRRIELGNAVATLYISTRKETAPVKRIGDLHNAQATGVQIVPGTQTGTVSRVRIRGQSSAQLSNDPIYIIDGIRMTSTVGPALVPCPGCANVSRVNDLNPEEIENIEIVKGPSAATLYGTDAANGVIVITTKRGRVGDARWNLHAERGVVDDRNPYPTNYGLRGHNPTTPNVRRDCRSFEIAAGSCILDSVVTQNIWENSELTPLKPGPRTILGGQVSGGTSAFRYMLSADRQEDEGAFGLPDFDRRRFDSLGVTIEDYMERPNYLKQYSFRANANAAITPKLDLAVSSGLTTNKLRLMKDSPSGGGLWTAASLGPGYDARTTNDRGWPLRGFFFDTPGSIFQQLNQETVIRFIGSVAANWRPVDWLDARADVGADLTDRRGISRARVGEIAANAYSEDGRTRISNVSSNLRVTARWRPRTWGEVRSTAGLQTVASDASGITVRGTGLPPGGEAPNQGTTFTVGATSTPSRTVGAYLEEQLAIRDRLYLTGAIRTDQNSAFGTNFQSVYYPKASLSWIVSDESFFPSWTVLDQLRFRVSYGASGVQPGATQALRTYSSAAVLFQGQLATGLQLANPGNADLQPERSIELEAGFDTRWWADRVGLEVTYYRKQTSDALVTQPVAPSAGVSGFLANLGGVRNEGFEYRLNAQVLDTRNYGLDFTFSGSKNTNEVTSLGGIVTAATASTQVGRPLNAVFARRVTFVDPNNDGVLAVADVTVAPIAEAVFRGPGLDPVQMSLSAGVELLGRRLRLSTLFDRKAGAYSVNGELQFPCFVNTQCKPINRLDAPLVQQAAAIARNSFGTNDGFVEKTAVTKWRELSATYDLGERLARRIGGRGATISAGMRNIRIWKDEWSGIDPEAITPTNANTLGAGLTTGAPSYYMIRLNLTY
jgi:TonB-linked SusC/RagA family outer membrane protein